MTTENNEGRCRGGPDDGEVLVSPRLMVAVFSGRRPIDNSVKRIGTYEFVAGQWLWKAA